MTKQELENIALLSKLNIKEDEREKILKDMKNIIEFANKVNLIDVSEVEFEGINNLKNVYRQDKVLPSYPQEDILRNAKTKEEGFFYLQNKKSPGGVDFDSTV